MKYAFVNGVILDGTQDMEPQSGKIILVDGEQKTRHSRRGRGYLRI